MIASSPASNWLSRTMPLKPSWAVGGPQKSNETTEELILPCRSALVTGYSARLVRSFTTPLNGYCIRLLPYLNGSNQPHGVARQRELNAVLDRATVRCGRRSTPDPATAPRRELRAPRQEAWRAVRARPDSWSPRRGVTR